MPLQHDRAGALPHLVDRSQNGTLSVVRFHGVRNHVAVTVDQPPRPRAVSELLDVKIATGR